MNFLQKRFHASGSVQQVLGSHPAAAGGLVPFANMFPCRFECIHPVNPVLGPIEAERLLKEKLAKGVIRLRLSIFRPLEFIGLRPKGGPLFNAHRVDCRMQILYIQSR